MITAVACIFVEHIALTSHMILQASIGYFLIDLAMILWYFPSLGGKEYVSITLL